MCKERPEGHSIFFSATFDPALNCKGIAKHIKKYKKEALIMKIEILLPVLAVFIKNTTNTRADTHVLYGIKCSIKL